MADGGGNGIKKAVIASVASGVILMTLGGFMGMRIAIAQMEGRFAVIEARVDGNTQRLDSEIRNLKSADVRHEARMGKIEDRLP